MHLAPVRSKNHMARVKVVLENILSSADEVWAARRRRSKAGVG